MRLFKAVTHLTMESAARLAKRTLHKHWMGWRRFLGFLAITEPDVWESPDKTYWLAAWMFNAAPMTVPGHQGLIGDVCAMSAHPLRVQPVSATPLEVYRLAFRSPRSFAVADW
jgi:hypothetical protein